MTRLFFRPAPGLTLAAVPALALLLSLGVWQSQRAQWKAGLMRDYAAAEAAPAAPLADALCAGAGGRVRLDQFPPPPELRMFGAGPQGEAGWRLIRAAPAPDCAGGATHVLVQTGFAPLTDAAPLGAPHDALLLEPWPDTGPFTPDNAPEAGEYYRFAAADLAEALELPADAHIAPLWAHWEARPAAARVRTAPETHIGYAVTWFGLAAALIAIYAILHVRTGRLGLRRAA